MCCSGEAQEALHDDQRVWFALRAASSYQSDGRLADEEDEDSDQDFPHLPRPVRVSRCVVRVC